MLKVIKSTKDQEINETLCSEDSVSPCSNATNEVGIYSVVPTDEALPERERLSDQHSRY